MIEFKNVSYHYGSGDNQTKALDDINLTIREGEFVVVLGANGSGKSTLARHINGLLMPSSGEVTVDGLSTADTKSIWEIRQRVGMVFQNPDNQLVATSVEEDVAFGPENLGVAPDEIGRRVREALAAVDMLDHIAFEPHLLSGGQKQRVAIAGALAMEPKYLVFDEATSMLDPRGRSEVMATVEKLNRERGITVLHITHIPEEAVNAGRVLVLAEGKIVMDAPPREVFSDLSILSKFGVGAPKARLIAESLIRSGLDVPPTALTIDDLVNALCS